MSSPIRAQPFTFTLELQDANSNQPRLNPPITAGDVKIIKDGGSPANIEALPTLNPGDASEVIVTLSTSEMDAERVTVKFQQQSGNDWLWESIRIFTIAHEPARQATLIETKAKTDLLPAQPAASGDAMAIIDGGITAAKIASNAISASKFAANAITNRVVSNEVFESIATAVEAQLSDELIELGAMVLTRLAGADYVAPDNASIDVLVQFAQADKYIDSTPETGWQHVLVYAGQELLRQNMLDIYGNPIQSINTPVAKVAQP